MVFKKQDMLGIRAGMFIKIMFFLYTFLLCDTMLYLSLLGWMGGLSYNLSLISLFSCQIWYDYVLMECRLVNLKLNSVNINSDVGCFAVRSFVSCLIITGLLVWFCVGGKNDIEIFNVSKLLLWVLVPLEILWFSLAAILFDDS